MRFRNAFLTSVAAAALALPLAAPAHATVSITCNDMKFDSSLEIVLGAGPVSSVLSVSLSVGGREFTTAEGRPGEKLDIAQAFDDGEVFRIDLVDPQVTKRMAAIRLIRSDHEDEPLQLGFVQIEDEPPIGISCIGP